MSSTASSVLRADKVWMDGRLVKWTRPTFT